MDEQARQPEERLVRIERLLENVLRELARRHERRMSADGPELLTKRAAARLLGCDRATTLESLIRSGRLHTVPSPSGKGLRIPRSEIERFERTGPPPSMQTPSPRRRKANRARERAVAAVEIAREIRAIAVPKFDE